jgi:outer membrane protein TolC
VDPSQLLAVLTNQATYQLGVQQQLHSGVVIKPTVSITRSDYSYAPGVASVQSAVQLEAIVPLWKDRFGAVSAAGERAAEHGLRAGVLAMRQTVAQAVLDATTAYWSYLAASKALDVARGSETRASEMLDDIKRLVAAEERPASDVQQATANLSSKRVSRIAAEQNAIEARAALGLAMGVAPNQMAVLGEPATEFPAVGDSQPPATAGAGGVLARRSDYAGAREEEEAEGVLASSARHDLAPRFDLDVALGYTGMGSGFGFGPFVAPLYRNVPGLNASVQFRYELPIVNTGAAGRAVQAAASYERQRITREDLARRIQSNVAVAANAVRHGRIGMVESQRAVTLAETTVANERRKFRLGASTMFDVIQAQDALTNAELSAIQAARTCAVAIATWRFENGVMVGGPERAPTVDVAALLAAP